LSQAKQKPTTFESVFHKRSDMIRNKKSLTLLGAAAALGFAAGSRLLSETAFAWQEKVVLITGGSKGLGLILARDILRKGGKVIICARDSHELGRAEQWLRVTGGSRIEAMSCDISDKDLVEEMVERINLKYGGIDVLINNAGIIQVAPYDFFALEDFEKAMDIMYWGTAYPIFAVLPRMRNTGGNIVNITSIGGRISVPHLLPYCAAKFATTGLSLGLRAELRKDNIQVTTIIPGLMRTGSFGNAYFKPGVFDDYKWFSLSSTMPGISIDAERAARQILKACEKGQAYKVIGLPAKIADRFNGVFPGLTANLMASVNGVLPEGQHEGARTENFRGDELEGTSDSKSRATTLGTKARYRFQNWAAVF
jgi:short-subunit dehydrogenase